MLGQMMKQPLLISAQIAHAARYHADGEIVSVETTGGLHRTNWGEVERRSRQLGSALLGLGLKQSDRVATLAWNNYRHLEAYFGVSGAGLVCHTINPRLYPDQIAWIINHAEDQVLAFRHQLPAASAGRAYQVPHGEEVGGAGRRRQAAAGHRHSKPRELRSLDHGAS